MRWLALLPLAGCLSMPGRPGGGSGDPDGGVDGTGDGAGAFACLGNTAPTTAEDTIVISGAATKVVAMSIDPAADVTVEVRSGASVLDSVGPTLADGQFMTAALTVSAPLDAVLYATIPAPATERPTLRYPPQPWVKNESSVPMLLINDSELDNLIQPKSQSAALGFLNVLVTDCDDNPINGATISVKQGGSDAGEIIDTQVLQTIIPGIYWAINVPVDDTTVVNASYQGRIFRAHTVKSIAATTTHVTVRPGF
ncbi:hypothetical protein BH11MYX3_BH11MYX3_32850 [soil metagenome]